MNKENITKGLVIILSFLAVNVILSGNIQAQVSISPSSISLSAYPGETHQINLSVTSDGNYILYFNSTNLYVTITPTYIITNNGIENITINLTFSKDVPNGKINFDVTGSSSVQEVIKKVYSGGGIRTIIKNQTIEVPRYIDKNITVIKEVPIPKENKPDYTYLLLTGLLIVLFSIIYLGVKLKKRNRIGNQKEDGKRKVPEVQQPENN